MWVSIINTAMTVIPVKTNVIKLSVSGMKVQSLPKNCIVEACFFANEFMNFLKYFMMIPVKEYKNRYKRKKKNEESPSENTPVKSEGVRERMAANILISLWL